MRIVVETMKFGPPELHEALERAGRRRDQILEALRPEVRAALERAETEHEAQVLGLEPAPRDTGTLR